jgi:hypothetical protein
MSRPAVTRSVLEAHFAVNVADPAGALLGIAVVFEKN